MQRVVLITGAAGGLGQAMAEGLAKQGYAVVMIDRNADALAKVKDTIAARAPGARLAALTGDLSDTSGIAALAKQAKAAFGRVDILINNAGLGLDSIRRDFMQKPIDFWEVDPDLIARFFAVNGQSPFLLARAVVADMMREGYGRIVNVTTSLDSMIRKGFAPYGGTKASLEAHSAIMAGDLAGTGVTVNVLVPGGPADTPMIPVRDWLRARKADCARRDGGTAALFTLGRGRRHHWPPCTGSALAGGEAVSCGVERGERPCRVAATRRANAMAHLTET